MFDFEYFSCEEENESQIPLALYICLEYRLGCHFILRSQLKLVFGSMNSEKYQNYTILGDIKMQCEYVAFHCKEYIFMQAKVPAPGQSLMRYIAEMDVTLLIG